MCICENKDQAGLYFRLGPSRTICSRNESCKGTILLACLKYTNFNTLAVKYSSNKAVWITVLKFDDGEFVINENNKRVRQVFLEEREFETLEEAETFINLEMVWKSERMRPSACGIKTGSKIVIALRDRVEPYKPKKKELDPDIVNELYVPGICTNQKEEDFETVKSLFNFDYRPTALIADAAHAITNGFMLTFS
ncbi:unnamed protein product [Brachionus calyciflorus]|uniref:Uncharacterized protein n=1 Tax=Brachionus calyciflorus TaxID=104777 RepID=A0A813LWB6_9BILA|nr:unnamed protein product [Brachionus calyciflorus]